MHIHMSKIGFILKPSPLAKHFLTSYIFNYIYSCHYLARPPPPPSHIFLNSITCRKINESTN